MTLPALIKIIVAMLLWAICFPLITIGLELSPHMTFAALRAVLAGVTLVLVAVMLGKPFPKSLRHWLALIVVGCGATSLGYLGMFHAAEFVSPGMATVIANTQPLMAAVIASIWLREWLSNTAKIGLLIGFAGILTIALPQLLGGGNDNFAIGIGYILLAAVGVTGSNLMIKRIAGEVDALSAMGLQLLIGSLPLGLWAVTFEDQSQVIWSTRFLVSLFGLGFLGSALVYWLWFSVLQTVRLTQANAFTFLVPVFGLLFGVVFFGEALSAIQWSGIAATLFGIYLVNRRPNERPN